MCIVNKKESVFSNHRTKSMRSQHHKDFIYAYSKMTPYLRPNLPNNKIVVLNVYQQYKSDLESFPSSQDSLNSKPSSEHFLQSTLKTQKRLTPLLTPPPDQPQKKKVHIESGFDSIDINIPDRLFYPSGWVPSVNVLETIPIKVYWKGAPLSIKNEPYFEKLHPVEASVASTLRLTPIQYLRCKRVLIQASIRLKSQNISFTKSIAQKLCRVDVNKTSALWTMFNKLNWFDPS